ncbi:acetyl-coenzyme A carboxylase carboxyltransferase subunit alpha AccA [Gottschalkia acidurici 9a]|uniref:Acetyl-coenzyme A carboxylase carboxyl transferase subunit alpha n=1 Tax=Gottschalkia acidurici (strain ATCC 7906 / DSM 604 / BCRC 14475 / CIP 104303 / KCTC 5404 / NCIMB 10678 / 9a) TaxID=1128398 RepID=K0B3H8_GOTA9|nr:acetyl-CoA carboxylase carboxyltransferase subunit alpha [Gottschalkia acidurici]AFS79390.1 acetyl-coenzyme A carboxylase carboxyltransferase subunit alpha AccA [Gottschalkia acidurici 9a]
MSNSLDFEKPIVELEDKIREIETFAKESDVDLSGEIEILRNKVKDMKKNVYENLSPWQKVKIARYQDRPTTLQYIEYILDDFIEFHGDRLFADDLSIVGGVGLLEGMPVTVIGHQKGNDTKENIKRNFGMPHPEGYRKALRLMKQAEKFKRPIITLINTSGAYCGIGAEERGQGEAIATNLLEMSKLKVPVIAIIIGEGGSGGALALGVGDKVAMLEHSIYSVISPEGLASILWKDSNLAKDASEVMKLTSEDLLRLKIIDDIIKEPSGGAHRDVELMSKNIKDYILESISELTNQDIEQLLTKRYEKIRSIGEFEER